MPVAEGVVSDLSRLTISPGEAAAALGVSLTLVYEMARSGRLPSFKVGNRWLISRRQFGEWVEAEAAAGWTGRAAGRGEA